MATTKRTTKLKLEKTIAGEQVLDLVISYINNVEDRNSLSLVSRKFYEIEGITRKRITANTLYSNPSRLSKRFPFIESITIEGLNRHRDDWQITPWIKQLALEFRSLKELHIREVVVHDEDLKKLARTRGKDLRSLKIKKCEGFTMDGLRHVSKYCNQLRTFCLRCPIYIDMKDGIWFHELALNSTVLERLHVSNVDVSYAEDLTLLAKKCCNSLISLKIGACYLSKLGDAFRYAARLEHFGGNNCDEERELVGFQFPPNLRSLSIECLPETLYSIVLPFLNQIRKLKLGYVDLDEDQQCLLFKRCPNLEVLSTKDDVCGDKGLQVIGKFCKKLRKLSYKGRVTRVGLIALAKRCTKLECLKVTLEDISNEAIECLGTYMKYLRKLRIDFVEKEGTTYLPLDNGVRAMLLGCSKLERLEISLWHGGLTDVGLEYIGKYGRNLRFLSLTRIGKSDAGLVNLSKGCPNLKELKLSVCPFSREVVTSCVFNMPSLRYVSYYRYSAKAGVLFLIRPEFQL